MVLDTKTEVIYLKRYKGYTQINMKKKSHRLRDEIPTKKLIKFGNYYDRYIYRNDNRFKKYFIENYHKINSVHNFGSSILVVVLPEHEEKLIQVIKHFACN